MKRSTGWMIAAAWVLWAAAPAAADVPNDNCGGKDVGDECEDYTSSTGVCALDEDEQIFCDTSEQPAGAGGSSVTGGSGGSGGASGTSASEGDDDDGGCSVHSVGARSAGELAGLFGLLLVCVAFRKRIG